MALLYLEGVMQWTISILMASCNHRSPKARRSHPEGSKPVRAERCSAYASGCCRRRRSSFQGPGQNNTFQGSLLGDACWVHRMQTCWGLRTEIQRNGCQRSSQPVPLASPAKKTHTYIYIFASADWDTSSMCAAQDHYKIPHQQPEAVETLRGGAAHWSLQQLLLPWLRLPQFG